VGVPPLQWLVAVAGEFTGGEQLYSCVMNREGLQDVHGLWQDLALPAVTVATATPLYLLTVQSGKGQWLQLHYGKEDGAGNSFSFNGLYQSHCPFC
jgi:hypothetical protein